MNRDELRQLLTEIGISQMQLSHLIDVTPRGINLWMTGQRGVPGPVAAYIRLLTSVPVGVRQAELARIMKKAKTMKDGMYLIEYAGQSGSGHGTLIFEGGHIYGADVGGGTYDGEYFLNEQTERVRVKVRVQMKAGHPSVVGIVQPFDWILNVETEMNPEKDADDIKVENNLGKPIVAAYRFLRPLPMAA